MADQLGLSIDITPTGSHPDTEAAIIFEITNRFPALHYFTCSAHKRLHLHAFMSGSAATLYDLLTPNRVASCWEPHLARAAAVKG
jgi:hypothetical protein